MGGVLGKRVENERSIRGDLERMLVSGRSNSGRGCNHSIGVGVGGWVELRE